MGYQTGPVRIRGKVGNLIFSKTANGDEVKTESSLNAERLRTDPRFKRTRENWNEFRRAAKAGKLIRHTFATQSKPIADSMGHGRLLKHTMRIVKSDYSNERGNRQLINGDFNNLLGYEFNVHQNLESTFKAQFEILLDRTAGTAKIIIPKLLPENDLTQMPGATHFKLFAAAVEFDWEKEKAIPDFTESTQIGLNDPAVNPQTLSLILPQASTKTIVVTMGVRFYQEVNGKFYQLSNTSVNAMAIIAADNYQL